MLTTIDNVPAGGRFHQMWWQPGDCRCIFRREPGTVCGFGDDAQEYISMVLVSACGYCRPPDETRENGGWSSVTRATSQVEFDPLVHALEGFDAVH